MIVLLIYIDENTDHANDDNDGDYQVDDEEEQQQLSRLTNFGSISASKQRTISAASHERDVEDESHHRSIDNDIDDDEEEMAAATASMSSLRLMSSAGNDSCISI